MPARGSAAPQLAVAGAVAAMVALGCGHAIAPGLPFQHAPRFDFRHPPCEPAPAPAIEAADQVLVRYLGCGGVYLSWRGAGLLTGPFFSNPGYLRSAFGRVRWDRPAIARGLAGIDTGAVGAVLVGHSHYDHLGDLPVVAREHAPRARLYVNRSGANLLGPFELADRTTMLEALAGRWTQLADADGRRLPFRVLAVPSDHAPHFDHVRLWGGDSPAAREPWRRLRYSALRAGRIHAFVVDLLDGVHAGAAVRFRVFLQDAAAAEPLGLPPVAVAGESPYDLAILCLASAHLVDPYPQALLRRTAPRHVLVTHYENFFRPWGPRRGFVPLLTRRRADRFLRRVAAALPDDPGATGAPAHGVCGPSAARWTMPLVGEWMVFRAGPRGRPDQEVRR